MVNYLINKKFKIDVGFDVDAINIATAVELTNAVLFDLPSTLYRSLDYKTTSAIIGSIFCDALASHTGGIVNPIEKGHPDIIPAIGADATEEQLRNYPIGLEIKCTVGNIKQGANLRAGKQRIKELTAITWQAHHREVEQLMGMIWDFVQPHENFHSPAITGIFYSDTLEENDWGAISGTTGRNTKVSGMTSSGKKKMGAGCIMLLEEDEYLQTYSRVLGFSLA